MRILAFLLCVIAMVGCKKKEPQTYYVNFEVTAPLKEMEKTCPAAVIPTVATQKIEEFGSGGIPYIHCRKCNTGVYLPHKDSEEPRCTYCGEKNN